MELFVILCIGIVGLILGRILMKRWYNHLTIYSFIWTVSLAFYTFRLIRYYEILPEAWFYIGLSWFMFLLGSLAVVFAQRVMSQSRDSLKTEEKSNPRCIINPKFLSRIIIVLSAVSVIAIIYEFILVTRTFGSISAAFIQANILYSLRVSGELSGIPYLSSFALTASCLAGIYTAQRRKLTFLSALPFILVGLRGIIIMGRTDIIIASALFLTALLYTPHKQFVNRKTIIGLISVIALTVGGFILISSIRSLTSYFKHESKEMAKVRSSVSYLPSLYFYLSAPPVAFSEYLLVGEEKFFPGTYTFKPVFNILSKVGFVDRHLDYNPFISTPESINAGTYLREIHADFGPLGIMIFPFVLGIVLTTLYFRVTRRPTTTLIVIFAHLFVIIWSSWDINAMKLGQWVVSILVSLFVALKLDSMTKER